MGSFYIKQCTAQIKLSGKFMNNLVLDFNVFEGIFVVVDLFCIVLFFKEGYFK